CSHSTPFPHPRRQLPPSPPPPLLPPPKPPHPPPPDQPPDPPPKPPPPQSPLVHPPRDRPLELLASMPSRNQSQPLLPDPPPRPRRFEPEKSLPTTAKRISSPMMPQRLQPRSCERSSLTARLGGSPVSVTPDAPAMYLANCHAAASSAAL